MLKSLIRCKKCHQIKKGVILKSYNLKLCFDCFIEFFLKRIESTIEKFKMFSYHQKILVALSGGKDSLALAKALKMLGYQIALVHLRTGIKINDYSLKSERLVKNFAKKENLKLKIIDFEKEVGLDLKTSAQIFGRKICSVCGMAKRYLLNQAAKNFDVLVTGHTLNDEAASLLSSLIFWKDEYLYKQFPILKEEGSLKRKAKPLAFNFESETKIFCEHLKINYLDSPCPFQGKPYIFFKKIIEKIEKEMPASILNFYKGFLKRKKLFQPLFDKKNLKPCLKCGYLTTAKICNFCRLKEKIKNSKK